MSRPAITTSSKAIASRRALTEPMEPLAPITMVLAGTFFAPFLEFDQSHAAHASAAAHRRRMRSSCCRRDGDAGASCNRDASIAHHLGEGTQAHDLGTQLLGDLGGLQQAPVGELRAVRQHFPRCAADGDQPALGLGAGGEMMFSILQYTMGGMCAASVSTLSMTNFGVPLGMGKPLRMKSWLRGG